MKDKYAGCAGGGLSLKKEDVTAQFAAVKYTSETY
jgi:hypothetical protein